MGDRGVGGKLPRFLDDFLRDEQRTFLEGEFDRLGELLPPFWYLGGVAYPLDADTAAAVKGVMDHFILPWGLVEAYTEVAKRLGIMSEGERPRGMGPVLVKG